FLRCLLDCSFETNCSKGCCRRVGARAPRGLRVRELHEHGLGDPAKPRLNRGVVEHRPIAVQTFLGNYCLNVPLTGNPICEDLGPEHAVDRWKGLAGGIALPTVAAAVSPDHREAFS